jgi:hypothetical protein
MLSTFEQPPDVTSVGVDYQCRNKTSKPNEDMVAVNVGATDVMPDEHCTWKDNSR